MRVRPDGRFLGTVHRELLAGRLAAAKLQRPYVWTQTNVTEFFESVVAGWPIGSLMLWDVSREQTVAYKSRLGPHTISLGRSWNSLVLDGQNRLATVAWAFAEPELRNSVPDRELEEAERATWRSGSTLVADLDGRCIRFVDEEEFVRFRHFPSHLLGSSILLNKELRAARDAVSDDDMTWLDEVTGRIREAQIGCTLIEQATPAEAAHVFRLVNKAGQPVTDEDIEHAFSVAEEMMSSPGPR